MKVGTMNSKTAEVNGTKKNRCVEVGTFPVDSKRAEQGNSLLGSKVILWVFSATILRPLTFARSYANLSLPKEAKFKRYMEQE